MRKIAVGCMAVLWMAFTPGCGSDGSKSSQSGPTGSMSVKVSGPAGQTLTGTIAAQDVFDPTHMIVADCMEKDYPLPGDGAFCDNLLVLPPGLYEVVVQPDDPNCRTEQAWYKVPVQPGQTSEISIVIVCGAQTGGLDVIVTESYGPVITDIEFQFLNGNAANKYICQYSPLVEAIVTVVDPDTACNLLTGAWSATPAGILAGTSQVGCQFFAVFNTSAPLGVYNVTFTVTDNQGHQASLTFPVHIITCPDP